MSWAEKGNFTQVKFHWIGVTSDWRMKMKECTLEEGWREINQTEEQGDTIKQVNRRTLSTYGTMLTYF